MLTRYEQSLTHFVYIAIARYVRLLRGCVMILFAFFTLTVKIGYYVR